MTITNHITFELRLLNFKINGLKYPIISKTISSALSNAKQKSNINNEFIYIQEAKVDEGPSLKRFCPHAQGRGFPIKKRLSHITIKLKFR